MVNPPWLVMLTDEVPFDERVTVNVCASLAPIVNDSVAGTTDAALVAAGVTVTFAAICPFGVTVNVLGVLVVPVVGPLNVKALAVGCPVPATTSPDVTNPACRDRRIGRVRLNLVTSLAMKR